MKKAFLLMIIALLLVGCKNENTKNKTEKNTEVSILNVQNTTIPPIHAVQISEEDQSLLNLIANKKVEDISARIKSGTDLWHGIARDEYDISGEKLFYEYPIFFEAFRTNDMVFIREMLSLADIQHQYPLPNGQLEKISNSAIYFATRLNLIIAIDEILKIWPEQLVDSWDTGGAKGVPPAIFWAIKAGNMALVKKYIDAGFPRNYLVKMNGLWFDKTLLDFSSNSEITKYLVDAGIPTYIDFGTKRLKKEIISKVNLTELPDVSSNSLQILNMSAKVNLRGRTTMHPIFLKVETENGNIGFLPLDSVGIDWGM